MAQHPALKFQFDRSVATSRVKDANEIALLEKALKAAELFINAEKSIYTFGIDYGINTEQLAKNLAQVTVENANWSDWKDKETQEPQVALSWINKFEINRIFINQTFWYRYKITKDQDEKRRIIFLIAMCIFHELGHLCLQWSQDQEFERQTVKFPDGTEKSFVVTPPFMKKEAGRYLECCVFGSELGFIIKEEQQLDWNKHSEIKEVFLMTESNEYSIISQYYISSVLNLSVSRHKILKFDIAGTTKPQKGYVAMMRVCVVDKQTDQDEESTPTKTNRVAMIRLCGTDLLHPKLKTKNADG